MADGEELSEVHSESSSSGKWILLILAVLYVAGSLYFLFDLRSRLDRLGKDQSASQAQVAELTKRMQAAEADDETLAQQLGITKKELTQRASGTAAAAARAESRLEQAQKEQISAVSGEVAG